MEARKAIRPLADAALLRLIAEALDGLRDRVTQGLEDQADTIEALFEGRLVIVIDADGGYLLPATALRHPGSDEAAGYAGHTALGTPAAPDPRGEGNPDSGPPCGTTSDDDAARRPE